MFKWSNAVPHMPGKTEIAWHATVGAVVAVLAFPYTHPGDWFAVVWCAGWLIYWARAWRFWQARPRLAALTLEFRDLVKGLDEQQVLFRSLEHGGAVFELDTLRHRFPLSLLRPTFYTLTRMSDDNAAEVADELDERGSGHGIVDVFICSATRGFPVGFKTKALRVECDENGEAHEVGQQKRLSIWQRSPFGRVYRSGVLFANEHELQGVVDQLRAAYPIEAAEDGQ